MFLSSESARSFRQSLPNRSTKSTRQSLAAFSGGPFSAFDGVEGSSRNVAAISTPLNTTHIQAVATAARTISVETHISVLISSLFTKVIVLRGGKAIRLTPEFDAWVQSTFGLLARTAAHELLVYGLTVVALVPPSKKRTLGVRALERTAASAKAVGVADATETLKMPVVVPLDDPDVLISIGNENGVRFYHVEHESMDSATVAEPLISVTYPPTNSGILTSPLTCVLNELSALSTVEELFVETQFQKANPVNLLQKRHGPGGGSSAGGGDLSSMFFDSESMAAHADREGERNAALVHASRIINQLQTRNAPPMSTTTGKAIAAPDIRTHIIPEQLESATHAMYPNSETLASITEARRDLFLRIGVLFSVPHGLTLGSGSSLSGSGPQFELFQTRLASVRSELETLLTACYLRMGLGQSDDVVKLQPHNPACRDVDTLIKLHEKGLLDHETASELASEAIGLDSCHANKKLAIKQQNMADDHHHTDASPRPSTAPSEAGS